MYEFLFQYMNKRAMSVAKESDKQRKPFMETAAMATRNNSITETRSPDVPLTSIIILTLNQLQHTKQCVESIRGILLNRMRSFSSTMPLPMALWTICTGTSRHTRTCG